MTARPARVSYPDLTLPARRHLATLGAAVLALVMLAGPAAPQTYSLRVADENSLGLTTSNYASFGHGFVNRTASMEYPFGSGYEHLTHGGVWIGAHALDGSGAFVGVTTAALDLALGIGTASQTEFTPAGPIGARSSLPVSPYYSPDAVSELDLISTYDDLVPKSTTGNPEVHRPLGVSVRQETYQWSGDGLESMVFVRLFIRNAGSAPLSDVWVGIYTELASGNKNAYSCWPPSSVCGPGSWFGKKWVQYDAPSRLVSEHYCAAQPVPGGCNLAAVPPWAGLQLLTPPATGQGVTLAAWSWSPGNPARDQDVERYALMSAGTIADLALPELSPQTGDPAEVLAVGPFGEIFPGDTVEVGFAFLGAPDQATLSPVAALAQQVYDLGYQDPVTPVLVSLVSAEAAPDRVRLAWSGRAPSSFATVERAGAAGGDPEAAAWRDLAAIESDASGRFAFDDTAVVPGASYDYRLRFAGGERTSSTRIDVPRAATFAIESVRPNPSAGGDPVVSFSLDRAGPARLEVVDLAGRRVRQLEFEGTPGRHLLRLDGSERLAPGIYLVRLSHSGRVATTRLSVIR